MLNFLPGWLTTKLAVYGAAVLAALFFILRLFSLVQKSGEDKQKVKEAQAREEDLNRIKHASTVKPIGSVQDDPNNRDTRTKSEGS